MLSHDTNTWCTQTVTVYGGTNTRTNFLDGYKFQRQHFYNGSATIWSPWVAINLATPWVQCTAGTLPTPIYARINSAGMVCFKGSASLSGSMLGNTLFTLPSYLAPVSSLGLPMRSSSGQFGANISIATNGAVSLYSYDQVSSVNFSVVTYSSKALEASP